MAGAGLTPGKAESLPTDRLSNVIPAEVQRILTVEFPNLALCKIGFNFKREMPRRRFFLLILTQLLADTEKCLWSWAINRATRTSLSEINPDLLHYAIVQHFECFRLMSRGVEKEFDLLAECFCVWKRLVVGIFAGVVEFRQNIRRWDDASASTWVHFCCKKIFQQASSAIYITSSTCEIKN
jgi:hypothetical protein